MSTNHHQLMVICGHKDWGKGSEKTGVDRDRRGSVTEGFYCSNSAKKFQITSWFISSFYWF